MTSSAFFENKSIWSGCNTQQFLCGTARTAAILKHSGATLHCDPSILCGTAAHGSLLRFLIWIRKWMTSNVLYYQSFDKTYNNDDKWTTQHLQNHEYSFFVVNFLQDFWKSTIPVVWNSIMLILFLFCRKYINVWNLVS